MAIDIFAQVTNLIIFSFLWYTEEFTLLDADWIFSLCLHNEYILFFRIYWGFFLAVQHQNFFCRSIPSWMNDTLRFLPKIYGSICVCHGLTWSCLWFVSHILALVICKWLSMLWYNQYQYVSLLLIQYWFDYWQKSVLDRKCEMLIFTLKFFALIFSIW